VGWSPTEIQSVAAPVLLIIGDSDIVRLEHAVRMFRLLGGGVEGDSAGLPSSQLAVLPGTTHLTLVDRAEWLASMISGFLDSPVLGRDPGVDGYGSGKALAQPSALGPGPLALLELHGSLRAARGPPRLTRPPLLPAAQGALGSKPRRVDERAQAPAPRPPHPPRARRRRDGARPLTADGAQPDICDRPRPAPPELPTPPDADERPP
jgi:hypothetical protein